MRPPESFVGQPVRSLQTMLRVIGEDAGQDRTVIPDGFYGNNTRDAVSEFQRLYGISVSGAVGPVTWSQIAKEYDSLQNNI